VVAGLVWTCIATTLCGCGQISGYVNNRTGHGFYQQGNYTAARHAFQRALHDNPRNADYAFNVAASMRKQGDVLGAERMYKSALRLEPSHQPAYHGFADMLREQGRMAEAQHLLSSWNSSQPHDAESYVEMAWMQQKDGDLIGAERSLQKALKLNPSHPQALAHLGHIYQQSGRGHEAGELYRRSLDRNPYQSEVHSNLAQVMQPGPNGSLPIAGFRQGDPAFAASGSTMMPYGGPNAMSGQPIVTYGEPFIVNGPPEMMNGQFPPGGQPPSATAGVSSSVPPMVMMPNQHGQSFAPAPHAPAMMPAPTYAPSAAAASPIQQVQYQTYSPPADPAHAPMGAGPAVTAF
jgi:Tfp pilus assembly protein PilF